nr:hypothetical protein [Tanacetum cinerariifolium]
MSNTISEDLLARCLKVKEIIDASIARIDSIRNDKAEEEISAKEAKESSYEGANNIIGKENGSKKEKNMQPTAGPTRVEPKPRRHNRMVEATEFWKKFVVSTSRTKKGIGGVLGEICGSSWDKQNTQVSISIRLSRGPYKTTYVLEELAKQHHGYYYYYLVSTKRIQRRTWDPRIQDHSKQHFEDKGLVCVVCLLVHDLIMNHGFLDVRGRNNNHRKKKTTDTGTCSASGSDGILNDATYHVDAAMKTRNIRKPGRDIIIKRKCVETIDVASGQKFNMGAMVLWTINDFPARSSLSGWSGQDTVKARQDLQRLGLRSGLWLGQTKKGKCLKPQAAYSFTSENQKKFCQFIKGVKLPDGSDHASSTKIKLCSLFKQICSATLMEDDMLKGQIKVVDILYDLELIYPHALFDIMIHLVIHLPLEALEAGPIRPRWMYPFERYMKKLKEEALTFSSHYFRDVTTKFNHPDHNVDPPLPTCQFQVFRSVCKSIGLRSVIRFDAQELKKVKWYVLHNSPEIDTYRSQFKRYAFF